MVLPADRRRRGLVGAETTEKIIKPILMEFPDPEPVGNAELTVQMQTIAAKIARMKRDSFVSPISIAKEVIA